MKAFVTGIGWVTANGIGRGRLGDRFIMPCGTLPQISRQEIFADPYPRFGRLDEFSRLGLAGIALALADAGLDAWQKKRDIGIVAGTRYGCLGTDMAYFDTVLPEQGAFASPNLFAYTLPNTFLGEAAIRFGLTGSTFVVNDDDPTALAALGLAMESLAWGDAPVMLAGICDLPLPELTTAQEPPGAVFLVLTRDEPPGSAGYATICLNDTKRIIVNSETVDSWPRLIAACLESNNR